MVIHFPSIQEGIWGMGSCYAFSWKPSSGCILTPWSRLNFLGIEFFFSVRCCGGCKFTKLDIMTSTMLVMKSLSPLLELFWLQYPMNSRMQLFILGMSHPRLFILAPWSKIWYIHHERTLLHFRITWETTWHVICSKFCVQHELWCTLDLRGKQNGIYFVVSFQSSGNMLTNKQLF